MKKLIALLLAAVMLFGLCACGGKTGGETAVQDIPGAVYDEKGALVSTEIPEEERYGGTLNLVYGACSDTFDPHRTTGWVSYYWSNGVYENPIARGANGEYVPCVCDFELSEDFLTLTLWPREGVTFHNGDAVEIDDVVATIDRSMRHVSNMKKFFAPYLAEGYPVVEDGKATYKFTEYNANTLYNFTLWSTWCGVMPKEILDKYGDEYINDTADCIGTGPYKLTEYQTNALYALERYEGYKPTELDCGGYGGIKKAYMDKINVWINLDQTSSTMAILNGDYDLGELPGEYAAMAEQNGLKKVPATGMSSMMAMAFNTKNPDRPIQDVNLRKAIAAALDYEGIAQSWTDAPYEITTCPVRLNGYDTTDIFDSADYIGAANLTLAKEYLTKSNYNGEEIVMLAGSGSKFATIWEANLKELGLNVKVEYMEGTSAKAYSLENSNPYDCITFQYEVKDALPCQISVTPRDSYWGNAEKDRIINEITKLPEGSEESIALWKELSQIWIDDCSVVNFARFAGESVCDADLVCNWPGTSYYYNAYWVNPAEHN